MFKRLPRPVALAALFSVLAVLAVWFLFTTPRRADVSLQKEQLDKAEREVAAAQAVVDSYLSDESQFAFDMEAVRLAEQQVAFLEAEDPTAELGLVLPALLARSFEEAGVVADDVSPPSLQRSTDRAGSVQAVSVNVRITGTVADLFRVIERIEANGFPTTLFEAQVALPRKAGTCPDASTVLSGSSCLALAADLLIWYSTARPVLTPPPSTPSQ